MLFLTVVGVGLGRLFLVGIAVGSSRVRSGWDWVGRFWL